MRSLPPPSLGDWPRTSALFFFNLEDGNGVSALHSHSPPLCPEPYRAQGGMLLPFLGSRWLSCFARSVPHFQYVFLLSSCILQDYWKSSFRFCLACPYYLDSSLTLLRRFKKSFVSNIFSCLWRVGQNNLTCHIIGNGSVLFKVVNFSKS